MPHWSGLLTTAEVTQKAATYTTQALGDKINFYINLIRMVQDNSTSQRTIDVRDVVDTNVERFFRVTMAYTTVHDPTGQPTGQTLLTKISW